MRYQAKSRPQDDALVVMKVGAPIRKQPGDLRGTLCLVRDLLLDESDPRSIRQRLRRSTCECERLRRRQRLAGKPQFFLDPI